ncbi:MAG: hypothetical protein Q8L48_32440 [Archangium sp.]|nr:hypothetical protein [Archangium sp.]
MKQRLVLAAVVLVVSSVGVLTWWLGRRADAPGFAEPTPPAAQHPAGPGAPLALPAPGQPSPEPVPLLAPSQVTAQLTAACGKIDAACASVPLWTPEDFEAAPRLRLARSASGAVIKPAPTEGRSPWARCVARTLAGTAVDDLALPAAEAEIACPPSTRPRQDYLWHDREPFDEVVRRCLREGSVDVDASLDLVVRGEVVEVQNVEVVGTKLDDWTKRCIEQELAAARVPFAPDDRPGFDRYSLKFKADRVDAPSDPTAAFTLARGEGRPRNPTDAELSQVEQGARDFPDNPYAWSRLGAAWARRHVSTGDAAASSEARQAYERFLALATPDDPLVPVIQRVLEGAR